MNSRYAQLVEWAKAIRAYREALRVDPENGEIWFNLGRICEESHQWEKAVEALREDGLSA